MKIGYARVSTHEQTRDLQIDDLRRADDQRLSRQINRLGRSLKDLIEQVANLFVVLFNDSDHHRFDCEVTARRELRRSSICP